MNTMVFLALLSVLGVAALFVALALYLKAIIRELEQIGGPTTRFFKPVNVLSKIRLGVRAIEVETGHILPQVTKLNAALAEVRDELKAIDANLAGVIAAVQRQEAK